MAEELDTTQKPKVELIKHQKSEQEVSVPSTQLPAEGGPVHLATQVPAQEHGDQRRKVVVIKKKAAVSGAPVPVKKVQPKIVVTTPLGATSRSTVPEGQPVALTPKAKSPAAETSAQEASETPREAKVPADGESRVTSMPNTQRPVAAAGRVGGRPVGNHSSRDDNGPPRSGSPFPPRPVGAAGRVGGRPVGPRPEGSGSGSGSPRPYGGAGQGGPRPGGFNQGGPRPGGFNQGGPRPGGFNQGGPRPGGFNQGGPRPGGFQGNRPGGFQGNRPGGFNQGGRPGGFNQGGRPGGPGGQRGGGMSPPPPPLADNKGPIKKSFKAKRAVYQRKEQEMEEKLLQTKKKITQIANPVPKSIDIMEVISVSELARKMNLKASDLIHKLMSMGMMVTINQQIDAETATILAAEFGADVKIVSLYDETLITTESDDEASLIHRPPVVTVMGHVDHGKTKLLDAIRSADVVSGEFGGITQHIGAYTVDTPHGKISFLDTPGHEAFTHMRARGAQVTDIVVLVVAADDGVMPQTIEAINHAKDAKVPIIVAVNKMDKPEANPDRVKSQLSDLGLMPEDWGGQTMFVELSALKKEGIDKLIDAILLQAEILDLKANFERSAEGKVLESRIDHGRGIVATVMIERGTLKIGDSFVAGVWPGKVRALFDDKGTKVEEATPAMPVEVLGFEGVPDAGDPLQVVDDEKVARGISAKRHELKRFEDAKNIKKITLDNLSDTISAGAIQELKIIIKSDVQGSAEALRASLEKLSNKEVRLNVIQALPGAINEGDVDLAIASNAIIIGFNVRPVPKAKILADQEKVDIRRYNIIYKAVEEIQLAMEGMLKPDTKEEIIASVEVRDTFKVPKIGTIAGCYVLTGTVKRSASINVIRDEIVIHTGKIASLRRFKDDAREVAAGYECGIGLEGFDAIQVGDQFEVFEIVEVARKLTSN
ncbi:translation initiation factor IF-2 [Treponema primitia]|uniref:translation initiation factor IF-2 n=1 Tax=Treponema primitia TaxID=88058 RepID=UPI00397F1717